MNPLLLIATQSSADQFPFLTLFWLFATLAFLTFLWWMTPDERWQAVLYQISDRFSSLPVTSPQAAAEVAIPESDSQEDKTPNCDPEAVVDPAPTEETEAIVEPSPTSAIGTSSESDDLTQLKGVTPAMASAMNREGIRLFEQLRSMNVSQRKELALALGVFALPWSDWEAFWESRS